MFALFFLAGIGAFVSLYNLQPIKTQSYIGQVGANNQTSSTSDSWISGLIGDLPAPFNDPYLAIIAALIITPITIMLGYISVRAIKDLISQWV